MGNNNGRYGGGYGGGYSGGYGGGYGYGGGDSSSNFCPAGLGYPAFCPRAGESGLARYCCQTESNGFYYGDCCVLPFGVGWLIAIILVGLLIVGGVTYMCCAWIASCPLAKRNAAKRAEALNRRQSVSLTRPRSNSIDDYGVIQKEVQSQAYYVQPNRRFY